MSDSDEDAAFASADEGDIPQTSGVTPNTCQIKENKDVSKSSPEKVPSKKDAKGKNKKKKKGGGKSFESELPQKQQIKTDIKFEKKTKELPKPDKKSADSEETVSKSESPTKTDHEKQTDEKNADEKNNENLESPPKKIDRLKNSESVSGDSKTPCKSDDSINKEDKTVVVESPGDETISRTVEKDAVDETLSSVVDDKTLSQEQSSGSWGWGWGSSILKTATTSVSTFTHQVGDGLTTLMDTVETTLNIPNPEELVDETRQDTKTNTPSKSTEETEKNENDLETEISAKEKSEEPSASSSESGAASGWFSNISSLVQSTVSEGMGVLETIGTGSLDVMEKLGKKTYSVITDHDPGLRKAREFLGNKGNKQDLSAVLRDAKEDAARKIEFEKEFDEARQCHFGFLFDEYQGLAHLEALEILSNQSEKKVQSLLHAMPEEAIIEIKPQLLRIKDIFEIEENDDETEEHDFVKLVTDQLTELHLGTSPDKLNKVQEKSQKWIIDFYKETPEEEKVSYEPKDIHKTAMQYLAELSSKSVEQFHKAGELVLLQNDSEKTFEERSSSLANLTQVLCTEVGILSTKFSQCLNKVGEVDGKEEVVNPLVTNIYLEATNSSTYIQDAFQLLLPVLQQATIQNSKIFQ